MESVIIIGGGPAGLSAGIYLARAGLAPTIFAGSPPGGQLTLTSEVENYPGYESIMGPELVEKMRKQAIKFGAKIRDENVQMVELVGSPFKVGAGISPPVQTKSVIIATGAKALWLGVHGEERLRGKGVSACATCDGFFFKNKVVGVVGGGDTALEEALTLTKFAKHVIIIHRKGEFRASKIMQKRVFENPKIEVVFDTAVSEVLGNNRVEGLRLKTVKNSLKQLKTAQSDMANFNQLQPISTDRQLIIDGLFVAIGHKPDTDIFKGKVEMDGKGYVITTVGLSMELLKTVKNSLKQLKTAQSDMANFNQLQPFATNFNYNYQTATSIDGVFAVGDCVDAVYRQAATAAGMGVGGALDVERWLEDK